MKENKLKFWSQRTKANHRGIEFNLTFEQWWDIWQQSGKWEQRGCRRGQYVMSRYNDAGAYEVGNVFIQTCTDNNLQRKNGPGWNKGLPSPMKGETHSPERIQNMRNARWGLKEVVNG
jgi:hypothetical protein